MDGDADAVVTAIALGTGELKTHSVFIYILFVQDITSLMILGVKCPSIAFLHLYFL